MDSRGCRRSLSTNTPLPGIPISALIRMAITAWARTRDNYRPRSTSSTANMTSSSGLTAGSIRLTTSRPTLPSDSSVSTPTLRVHAPAIWILAAAIPEPQLIANSIYHGLQLSAEKYSNGLQLLATFVWSKSIDDSSQADWNVSWLGSIDSLQTRISHSWNAVCQPSTFHTCFSSATSMSCLLGTGGHFCETCRAGRTRS